MASERELERIVDGAGIFDVIGVVAGVVEGEDDGGGVLCAVRHPVIRKRLGDEEGEDEAEEGRHNNNRKGQYQ